MFEFSRFLALIGYVGLLAKLINATIDPLEIEDSRFVYKTNRTIFAIRGITFLPPSTFGGEPTDPLANRDTCTSLVPTFLDLGINVLAIEYVNVNNSHTRCLDVLGEAGIYVYAKLPDLFQGQGENWDQSAFTGAAKFVDSLENHNAIMGISIGRIYATTSMFNQLVDSTAGPLYKAAIRDLKRHSRNRGFRNIPIGLGITLQWPRDNVIFSKLVHYLECGDVHADFLALGGARLDSDPTFPPRTRPEYIDPFIPLIVDTRIPMFMTAVYSSSENMSIAGDQYIGDKRKAKGKYGFIPRIFEEKINGILNKLSGVIVDTFFAEENYGGPGVYDYRPSLQYAVVTAAIAPSASLSTGGINSPNRTMPGFFAISTAFAAVKSSEPLLEGTIALPTIAACASFDVLNISLKLPPQNYPELCSCMEATLRCVKRASANILFSQKMEEVCGENKTANCIGIIYDTENGHYGAYSVCEPSVRYSYAADRFWRRNGNGSCDLNGTVYLRDENPPPYPQCSIILQKAELNGENTVDPMVFSASEPSVSPTGRALTSDVGSAHSGLSSGSKAGIAIGTVIFAISAVISVVLLFLRWKRTAKTINTEDTPFHKSELDGKQVTKADYLQEVGDEGAVKELYVLERVHEITTLNDERIELPVEERPVETQA